MLKIIKRVVIPILVIICLFILYLTVGNLFRGITGAKLIGDGIACFMGYYLIAGAYFIAFILLSTVTIIIYREVRYKERMTDGKS